MRTIFQKGITMIEVMVVVVILIVLLAVTTSQFSSLRQNQALQASTTEVISVIKKANSQTLASIDSSQYGVHFGTDTVIIFKGTSYPSDSDETITLTNPAYISDVSLSGGGNDVYFSRLTGVPNKTGTVTISINGASKIITIGATGIISVN
ncbi:MAG TPA: hypothetical protein VJB09_02750 [Candidatus Paceibacterota bacterium]